MKQLVYKRFLPLYLLLPVLFHSCSKDDPVAAAFVVTEEVDRFYLDTSGSSPGAAISWRVSDTAVEIRKHGTNYYFMIPDRDHDSSVEVTLTVTEGNSSHEQTRAISLPRLTQQRKYGLGKVLTNAVSNNVPHGWYIDQGKTGQYAEVNCGPACTEMALRWADPSYTGTAAELRELSGMKGDWTTGHIYNTLSENRVSVDYIELKTFTNLKSALDAGHIALLCVDIYYVREEANPDWRIDKFYRTASRQSGHFVIAKGYREVDGGIFLECYDPWSWGKAYGTGQSKGKDRYYRLNDLLTAASDWWAYAIIVSGTDDPHGRSAPLRSRGLDPAVVPVQSGG